MLEIEAKDTYLRDEHLPPYEPEDLIALYEEVRFLRGYIHLLLVEHLIERIEQEEPFV